VSGRHARLRGRDLYRQIVIAHKQADPDSAPLEKARIEV